MVRVLPLVVVLCFSACSRSTPAQAATTPQAQQTGTAAPQPAALPPGAAAATPAQPPQTVKPVPAQLPDILARVNGETITKADFDKAVNNIQQRAGGPVPPDQRDRIYRGLLDQLIGYKLLIQETKVRKVDVPDAEIDARLSTIRQQFPSEAEFEKKLQEQQMTVEKLKSDARQDMAVAKMIEAEVAPKVSVKPEEIEAFYKANPQNFQQAERVRASHILITVPKGASAEVKAAARAKAEGLLKEARAGKDFAALAKANSQDPGSAPNGGDLGYFQKGEMVGPFDDAAFSLAPGAISDVIETDYGFHIIKVADKQPGRVVPVEEARPKIQQFLEDQNKETQTEVFVSALKAKSKVEIYI